MIPFVRICPQNQLLITINFPLVKKYEFYLQNNALNKIRVVFDKESIGKRELQQIYNQLTTTIGVPVLKLPIYKEIDNLTLKGNTLNLFLILKLLFILQGLIQLMS